MNGDGFDDVIVGAPYAESTGEEQGESYVVFGKATWTPSLDLASLDGTNGFRLIGIECERSERQLGLLGGRREWRWLCRPDRGSALCRELR